jgi:short-subunit dehydrogenase
MMMTKTKVVLITGASRGIGKAIALQFAKNGFDLFLSSKNASKLSETLLEVQLRFPDVNIRVYAVDLSTESGCNLLVTEFKKHHKQLNVLVNNAGMFLPGTLMDEDSEQMKFQMNLNFFSAYYLTKGLWSTLKETDRAHVFNMCSIASITAYAAGGGYSVSKFALLGFNKSLRLEGIPMGIRVSAILPGATLTDSWAGVDLPESRFMKPDDVAEVIWQAYQMNERSVMEEILIRPILGDI